MYIKMVELNDNLAESFFEKQVEDEHSRYFGGVIEAKTGIPSPSHTGTGSVIGTWVSAYINEDSRFYHNNQVASRIDNAMVYMLDQQHDDGTISPGWTNYHSPPDTGFIVTGFSHIHQLLEKDDSKAAPELSNKVKLFLKRALPAMLTGGCHTPNHRWVLASALCHLYLIFRDKALLDRAEQWLSEGIDITEDGEWTERSNGIYNTVSDIFLYHIAQILDKPELLDYVRSNLNMMQYLVHPDGEVITDYSGRQDFGTAFDFSQYYLVCRLMGYHDSNPVYDEISELAAERLTKMGPVNNHIMLGYLMFPFIKEEKEKSKALPTTYEKVINGTFPVASNLQKMKDIGHGAKIEHSSMHESFGAPIVRYRKDTESVTIMTRNPSVFSLRKGDAKLLGVRIYSSFSPGLVSFDNMEKIEDGYRLTQRIEKGYRGPIPEQHLSEVGNVSVWYLLPHQHRELTHNQTFEVEIDVIRVNDGWTLHFKSYKQEDVFMQVEFLFSNEGSIQASKITKTSGKTQIWKDSELTYQANENSIQIGTGAYEHWMENIGAYNEVKGVQAVKANLLSPVDKHFHIQVK